MRDLKALNIEVPLLAKLDQDLMNAQNNAKRWETVVSTYIPTYQRFTSYSKYPSGYKSG